MSAFMTRIMSCGRGRDIPYAKMAIPARRIVSTMPFSSGSRPSEPPSSTDSTLATLAARWMVAALTSLRPRRQCCRFDAVADEQRRYSRSRWRGPCGPARTGRCGPQAPMRRTLFAMLRLTPSGEASRVKGEDSLSG